MKDWGMFRSSFNFKVRSPVLIFVPRHVTWWGPETTEPKFSKMSLTFLSPVSSGRPRTRTQVPPGKRGEISMLRPRSFIPATSKPTSKPVLGGENNLRHVSPFRHYGFHMLAYRSYAVTYLLSGDREFETCCLTK